MKIDPNEEMFIAEFINVSETSTANAEWMKLWGMLIGCNLTLNDSKSSEKARKTVKVGENVEIQPAVKETGKILAFKLVDKGTTLVVLEPLNITDMGRWISSLFAAIQGVANLELITTKVENVKKSTKAMEWNETIARTQSVQNISEPNDVKYTVKVKDLAKLFENLGSSTEASKPREITVKRSVSSPNLASRPQVVKSDVEITKSSETVKLSRQHSQKMSTAIQSDESWKKPEKIKSHKGSYMAQQTENAVLTNMMNPHLAKQRLAKQQEQLQRLEVIMKSVVEKVKRQCKALEETESSIKELESQSTTPEDFNDVAKLNEQKAKLENNIRQSEESVQEYKVQIVEIEDEMRQWEKVIADSEAKPGKITQEPSKTFVVTEYIQLSSPNHVDETPKLKRESRSKAPTKSNGNNDEPEWISKARQKSEAIKKLAAEGMLN